MSFDRSIKWHSHLGHGAGMRNLRTRNFQRACVSAAEEIREYLGYVPSQRLLAQAKRHSDSLPTSYSDIQISRSIPGTVAGLGESDSISLYVKGSGAFDVAISGLRQFLTDNGIGSFQFRLLNSTLSIAFCSERRFLKRSGNDACWRCMVNESPWCDHAIIAALGLG
jgi:hypothetical protein